MLGLFKCIFNVSLSFWNFICENSLRSVLRTVLFSGLTIPASSVSKSEMPVSRPCGRSAESVLSVSQSDASAFSSLKI